MRYLELTLPTAVENLALDEALLDEAEASEAPDETLRIWESPQPLVVVGRSSQFCVEVRLDACRKVGIPVLRRPSGGAAIVAGPGCLMYALVLELSAPPAVADSQRSPSLGAWHAGRRARGSCAGHRMPRHKRFGRSAAGSFRATAPVCRRDHLLYHGTLLYDFPLELVERCLAMPPRMPDYREGRPHESFVTNLPLRPEAIREALVEAFAAGESRVSWPDRRTAQLVAEKYSLPEWRSL